MTKHFERTDVTWKPLCQVQVGDQVYGMGKTVSKLRRVIKVTVHPDNSPVKSEKFRTHIELEGNGSFEGWSSTAIASPLADGVAGCAEPEIDCNTCGKYVPEAETIACSSCGMPACPECQEDHECIDCADRVVDEHPRAKTHLL